VAHGVIESNSMSAFVEGALALKLPHIYVLFFPIPLICLFLCLALLYLQDPFVGFQAISNAFSGPV
jgi:hypothetical protein